MIDISSLMIGLKGAAVVVLPGLFRSFFGWSQNALKDKKVTPFEWRQLAHTMVRVGSLALGGYLGLSWLDIESAEMFAILFGFLADKVIEAIKK